MHVEVIATGTELCVGQVVDTNGAFIGVRLLENGLQVRQRTTLPDKLDLLQETFRKVAQRADAVVVTGGLGPTSDDITTEALALAANRNLAFHPGARRAVRQFYALRNRDCHPDVLHKLSLLPEEAEMIANPVGTAPGFRLVVSGCRFYVLPGVPAEMKAMFDQGVLTDLLKLMPTSIKINQHLLTTFGISEPQLNGLLVPCMTAFPSLNLGFQLRFPEIVVKLWAAQTEAADLAQALDMFETRLGASLVSKTGLSQVQEVARLLKMHGQRLAVAESCTGGLIAHELTNQAGSSAYFDLGVVSYANHAKTRMLQIDPREIERQGAVSAAVVKTMAASVRDHAGADWGIATSGIAGPEGGTPEKPVGTVWIGMAHAHGCEARQYRFDLGDRLRHKRMFAFQALDLLRCALLEQS